MSKTLLVTLILILVVCINAQSQTGKINGVVKSADNKPLESATLSLLKAKDSSLVKIAIADKTGNYRFENIHYGTYLLQAEAIGYQKNISKALQISAAKPSVTAGEIKLTAAA